MKTFKQFRTDLNEAVKLKDTKAFVVKAHAGQEREPGVPYHTHPIAVARTVRKMFGRKANKDTLTVAGLHDVPEDTPYTLNDLKKMGHPHHVVQAVGLLTKDKSKTYGGNIKRIIASKNIHAMMVKAADNHDNLMATPPPHWTPAKIKKSKEKYRRSRDILVSAISRMLKMKKDLP